MPLDASPPRPRTLRVGVVGARTVRQGIGPHLARFVASAGARVVAVAGTSPETARAASDGLLGAGLPRPTPFPGVEPMLAVAGLDALVVATPHEAHEASLAAALPRGLHVLCEKPLVWGGPDPAGRARALAADFRARGLHLAVVAQWPYTLPTFFSLHPDVEGRVPGRFEMQLSPRSTGLAMLPDAVPHALSLLATLAPAPEPRLEGIVARLSTTEADLRFDWVAGATRTACRVLLRHRLEPPRPASYAVDGREVRRHVDLDGYRLSFESAGRRVPLPDPTEQLVRAFVDRVCSGREPVTDPAAWPGMRLLQDVQEAVTRA